jgi:alpha-tubulin suppressor-like RCC1 family protein
VIKELTVVGSVTQVSCGDEHALALMSDKKVFSWGNKELGVLGYGVNGEYQTTPLEVEYFTKHNINVCNVVCGSVHNIAIDSKGCLYGWGDNKAGQLGLGGVNEEEYFTTPVKLDNTRIHIVSLAMKELHSIGVNASGKVFSWGSSPNGQLGVGTCMHNAHCAMNKKLAKASLIAQTQQHKVTTPTHITTLNHVTVANVECGGAFSMFISNNGCLYACGLNDQGQLGINDNNARDIRSVRDCKDITRPIRVECFVNNDMKVVKIACGESHCVAIVKEVSKGCTSLWSWGNNKFGQLGMGSECRCNLSCPRRIKYFEGFKCAEVVDVSCGFQHSVCVVRNAKGIQGKEEESDEENGERVVKECIEIICDVYDNILNN